MKQIDRDHILTDNKVLICGIKGQHKIVGENPSLEICPVCERIFKESGHIQLFQPTAGEFPINPT